MFTLQEISDINEKIGFFMGYIYHEPSVWIDYSECGGLDTEHEIFSKVPIEIVSTDNDIYLKNVPNLDYQNYSKPPMEGWNRDLKTISWGTLNLGSFVHELNYHKDWNSLMEVVEKIENIGDDYDLERNYHIFIGKRHTRVIYNWGDYTQGEVYNDIKRFDKSSKDYRHILFNDDKRLSTWFAVSEFIDWYNEKTKK